MKTITLEIEVGRLETREDLQAFLLKLEAWCKTREVATAYALSRRRTDVREEKQQPQQRGGRDGLL